MEWRAALDSGQVVVAKRPGVVTSVTADRVQVETDAGELDEYLLQKYVRSNQGTCINQRPIVDVGQRARDATTRSPTRAPPTTASSPSAATSWSRS